MSEQVVLRRSERAIVNRAERAFRAALVSVEEISDLQRAFMTATALVHLAREFYEGAADLRARKATAIRDAEQLSLTQLADRVGVSKTRAVQLLKQAKREGQS